MARRRTNSPRHWEKRPNTYARTTDTWTTRYYARKMEPIFDMFGMNTANDAFHKKDGSSPFLANVRYMGEREKDQRAQVMSRKGAGLMSIVGDDTFDRTFTQGKTYLTLYEGKAIEWRVSHSKLLSGISLFLANPEEARGYVELTIRSVDTKKELANAVIDTSKINIRTYERFRTRFIRSVRDSEVIVRARLLDDMTADEREKYTHGQRTVRILATPTIDHEYAEFSSPNVDEALREQAYVWQEGSTGPLTGVIINDWETMPRCQYFRAGGRRYVAYPVKDGNTVALYKTDLDSGVASVLTEMVDNRAEVIRFEQAEGYLYYVDGWSPLRRINLTTFVAENVVPLTTEITVPNVDPSTLTAKEGASLIHFLNNRMYLSGFKDDPNLVIQSLIDDVKPRFEQYDPSGYFYSPDQSPELSAGSAITALADINDYLVIFRIDGNSMYDRGSSTVLEDASQVTPEGAQLGVLNQEAVAQGKNNIYFFNPIEGVCRFGGSLNRGVSLDIENIFKQIQHKDKVFMMYHNKRLRFYYSLTEEKPDSCLYYYSELEGRLPWYQDKNTPVAAAVGAKDSEDIYALHSETPAIMNVDSQFSDFDSFIEMEYHTQYRVPTTSSPNGESFIKRLHIHEITDESHSIFVGLDLDFQDKPIVYKRYVDVDESTTDNPDAVFQSTGENGIQVFSIPLYARCRRYQLRIKRYCYKDQAEFAGAALEYGDKEAI